MALGGRGHIADRPGEGGAALAAGPAMRHFWRRFLAFWIDYFIVLFLCSAASVPLVKAGLMPPLMTVNQSSACETLKAGPIRDRLMSAFARHYYDSLILADCEIGTWPYGSKRQIVALASRGSRENGTESRLTFVLTRQPDGSFRPADTLSQNASLAVFYVILIGYLAVFSAGGRRSPGKRVMKLRVETVGAEPLSAPLALRREALKIAPFLAATLAAVLVPLTPLVHRLPSEPGIGLAEAVNRAYALGEWYVMLPGVLAGLLFLAVLFHWFFASFDHDTGQLDYETFSGTRVVTP